MENEKDYSSFMQRGEDGAVTSFDEDKFSSFIDSLIGEKVNKGIENYKAKTAKEQEMAKMSNDEKYNQLIKEFETKQAEWENLRKSQMRDIVVEKAKSKLAGKFSESEIKLLTANVSDDEKASLKYIDELVAERDKFLEESKKQLIEELQSKQPKSSTTTNASSDNNRTPEQRKNVQAIKDLYK